MIVLSAKDICKSYVGEEIFSGITFSINEGDRVGLIGDNGAGKTTLLNILANELSYDSGEFFVSKDTSLGYLKQKDYFDSENTVIGEVENIFTGLRNMEEDMNKMSIRISEASERGEDVEKLLHQFDEMQRVFDQKGGYTYKSEINGILSSMAFPKEFYDKKISTLSGGEKTRLALACLLLKKPKILLLDEPTNHLDIGTLKWLEQYLSSYQGTIILISHDRYFLDKTVNRIFELERGTLSCYEGNYSSFAEKKAKKREADLKKYEKQQEEIARQEEIIRRFKQHNTEHLVKRAQSREKMLEHMELLDKPDGPTAKMKINFKQSFKSGTDVLFGEDLSIGFGYGERRRELFKNVNFDIKRGERICIVGANGIGKTTLLKLMMEIIPADSGRIKKGYNVEFGYYDQGQELLNNANTLLDELKESYRLYSDTEMRSIMGRFLFRGDMVFQQISSLSGGEKARLSLLKLMLSESNVLVLDEPTNHLDISSKEIFEDALKDFPGTVIVVSHDRYFLNKVPDRIMELTADGLVNYVGGYDYYLEKKQSMESGKAYLNKLSDSQSVSVNSVAGRDVDSDSNLSQAELRKLAKEKEAEERRRVRENTRLEEDIARLEEEIEACDKEMCIPDNFANHELLAELDAKSKALKAELDAVYEKWLALQE